MPFGAMMDEVIGRLEVHPELRAIAEGLGKEPGGLRRNARLQLTISLMRLKLTPMCRAKASWVIPSG